MKRFRATIGSDTRITVTAETLDDAVALFTPGPDGWIRVTDHKGQQRAILPGEGRIDVREVTQSRPQTQVY